MKKRIEKRLSYLYTGESVAIIGYVVICYLLNKTYPNLKLFDLSSFWVSSILFVFLLLQGTIYWYSKWKRLKQENTSVTPTHIVRRLKGFIKWNWILIGVGFISFIVDYYNWSQSLPKGGLAIAGFMYIFSILEFINYFYIQLSYDNLSDLKYLAKTKKLKEASLRKDFKRER